MKKIFIPRKNPFKKSEISNFKNVPELSTEIF